MDYAVLVGGGEPREYRLHDVHGLGRCEYPVFLQQVAQRDAGKIFHDEVRGVVVLALVIDIDHVRMREPRRRPRLLDEAGLVFAVVGEMAVHDLDGNPALEPQIGGQVDGGHASTRDS
jgi:hypothetical protein